MTMDLQASHGQSNQTERGRRTNQSHFRSARAKEPVYSGPNPLFLSQRELAVFSAHTFDLGAWTNMTLKTPTHTIKPGY